MGGFGSGRHGGGPTVNGLVLDADRLHHRGMFGLRGRSTGTVTWTNSETGELLKTIHYDANMGEAEGTLWVTYTSKSSSSGEKRDFNYKIEVVSTALRLGGRRWYFLCPRTGIRCLKLHLPAGAGMFASRRAYRLAYPSQRETNRDRSLRAAFRARYARLREEVRTLKVDDARARPSILRPYVHAREG